MCCPSDTSKYLKLNDGRLEVSALALLLAWSVNCSTVVRVLVTLKHRSTSATQRLQKSAWLDIFHVIHIAIKISIRALRRIPRKHSSVVIVSCSLQKNKSNKYSIKKIKINTKKCFSFATSIERELEIMGYTTCSIWLGYSSQHIKSFFFFFLSSLEVK